MPFDGEAVRRTLRNAWDSHEGRAALQAENLEPGIEAAQSWLKKDSRLVFKSRGKIVFANIDDIDWLEAAENYVLVHSGSEMHSIRGTITAFESKLDPSRFIRVHRSAIVNIDKIKELRPRKNGDLWLVLRNGKELSVSRAFRARIHRFVRGLDETRET